MRLLKYLVPLHLAVVFYAAASALAGPAGLDAYRQLERERRAQEENLRRLRQTGEHLRNLKAALKFDEDTISVYARDLGYGNKEEYFVRIVGLGAGSNKPELDAGEIHAFAEPFSRDDTDLRVAALVIGLFSLFIIGLADILTAIKNL